LQQKIISLRIFAAFVTRILRCAPRAAKKTYSMSAFERLPAAAGREQRAGNRLQ
jgi:hypothetical protein